MEHRSPEPDSIVPAPAAADCLDDIVALLRSDPQALAEVSSRLAPADSRTDGWTPFARRLFLEVLAETGRVSTACEYTRLTRQSAYALRARDPLFAASWDAACELARQPLADALYEKALDGVTDIITKDGEVVATRHRFDSRLSIAVLNRLDKRCDRAEERGSRHLAVAARWDECMNLIAADDTEALRAVIDPAPAEPAQHCQTCQLPESENPTASDSDEDGIDLSDRCWKEEEMGDMVWYTDFPPPPGYEGHEKGTPSDHGYQRECTSEEAELLDAHEAQGDAEERADEEQLRDCWFEMLREQMAALTGAPTSARDHEDEMAAQVSG
jgi:hypothetical protein